MQELADFLGLDLDYFPAVSKFDRKLLNKYNLGLSNAQKACYLSHYFVLEEIIKNDYRTALIIEDDVDFELEISKIMSDFGHVLPHDWELLYVGNSNRDNEGEVVAENGKFKLHISTWPTTAHSYAVSANGARKLIKDLSANQTRESIDNELTYRASNGFVKSYTIDPPLMIQWKSIDNPSDISSGRSAHLELLNSTKSFLGYKQT
ncbi:1157_t:CDS:1, partial [Racocetra fulgida]